MTKTDSTISAPVLVFDRVSVAPADPRKLGSKRTWALEDATFVVAPGEAVGLLGERGAGKSALINAALGEARASTGTVYVRSQPALIAKATAFLPAETIRFNIVRLLQGAGLGGASLRTAIDRVSRQVGAADSLDREARDCDPVLVNRIRLASVLRTRPALIVVDDPRFRLDQLKVGTHSMVAEYLDGGGSLIVASDDLKPIRRTCQRLLWLDAGRLVADGPLRVVARNADLLADALRDGDARKAAQLRRRFASAYKPPRLLINEPGRRKA